MLEVGAPAVEVMVEYVRACRRLGHPGPEPASLHAAYTAEDGLDLPTLDADHRMLSDAVAAVEEARGGQEQARRALTEAWRGAGAVAAADHLQRHADAADAVVEGLRGAALALGELRNRLWQLIEEKVTATQDIEGRGMRAEWLSASRAVTTGAGEQSGASEMVDMCVAPFVANDIAHDWVSAMRDTESGVRQAYRDAAAAMTTQTPSFDRPDMLGSIPVAAESVSVPATAVATAPAGISAGPASPAQMPAVPSAAVPPPPVAPEPMPAAPLSAAPVTADPMAGAVPGAPMSAGTPGLGAGMSGLSGLGQSFADMLGGLLGGGGGGFGENIDAPGDLDVTPDDVQTDDEPDDLSERDDDENEEEKPEEDEVAPEEPEEPVEPDAGEGEIPVEPLAPVAVPPVSTPPPIPDPLTDPAVVAPAEPAPADTPCEIAADELPQAGP